MKQKAFLGPIGDDLPSLIPLMFALIIFFSGFYMAMAAYTERGEDFDNDLAVTQISNALRGTGFISGVQDFDNLCNSLNIQNPKYFAALTELSLNPEKNTDVNIFDFEVYKDKEGKEFICTNFEEDFKQEFTKEKVLENNYKIVYRIYPVVLDVDFVVTPMQLVVIAWR